MSLPVITVVGHSNSGKTRVAVRLIRELSRRGYSIAAVKHCPHGHQPDKPGSDSARLFDAGAERVLVNSPDQLTSFQRTDEELSLEEIVASLDSKYDLLIAEGFKDSTAPKILVTGRRPFPLSTDTIIAVVGLHPISGDVPFYSFEEMDALIDQVERRVISRTPSPSPVL